VSKHVAVLMGGWSAEREVSLDSGKACARALSESGFTVSEIDVTPNLRDLIDKLDPKPDAVFNALHGRVGEDGTIQGVLNILGIPYTHSGLLASAVAMDKPLAKELFAARGIRCPRGQVVDPAEVQKEHPIERPYVVKPAREGSSVGVTIVREGDNGPVLDGWEYGDVLAEQYVPGRELTVAVMAGRALGVTELRPHEGFYNYEAKYTEGKTTHLCPAPLPPEIEVLIKDWAERAHDALGCRGISRSDFRWDDRQGEEGVYLLEVNTQPGMTALSLVPEQAAYVGVSFPDLVRWMVENAACDA